MGIHIHVRVKIDQENGMRAKLIKRKGKQVDEKVVDQKRQQPNVNQKREGNKKKKDSFFYYSNIMSYIIYLDHKRLVKKFK